jgi:hypothetical protein
MAAEAEPNPAELLALLERLNSSLDSTEQPLRPAAAVPTPDEALGLYFVAARLVELQLRLLERDENPVELARQVAVTRDVLMGTRTVLQAALDGVGPVDALAAPAPSAAPKLRVVHGGRGLLGRPRHGQP